MARRGIQPIHHQSLVLAHSKGGFEDNVKILLEQEFEHLFSVEKGTSEQRKASRIKPSDRKEAAGGNSDDDKTSYWAPRHTPPVLEDSPVLPSKKETWGNLMGLALSGGGIRSAVFSLGVMQYLARKDLLKNFDYLSTVSGGGYMGSSITWWLSSHQAEEKEQASFTEAVREKLSAIPDTVAEMGKGMWRLIKWEGAETRKPPKSGFGLGPDSFPYGTEEPSLTRRILAGKTSPVGATGKLDSRMVLRFLRQHCSYLTPGDGFDMFTGISSVVRSVFLSLLGWFLLACVVLIGAVSLSRFIPGVLELLYQAAERSGSTESLARTAAVLADKVFNFAQPSLAIPTSLFEWYLVGAVLYLLYAFGMAIFYSVWSGLSTIRLFPGGTAASGYLFRRLYDRIGGHLLKTILVLTLIGSVPYAQGVVSVIVDFFTSNNSVVNSVPDSDKSAVSLVSLSFTLIGLVISGKFFRSDNKASGSTPLSFVRANLGAGILLYGMVMWAWLMTRYMFETWPVTHISIFVAIGVLFAWAGNLNMLSLHRFYRDRLMESFLPEREMVREDGTKPSVAADKAKLASIWERRGPFPLINTNVVLVNSEDTTRKQRGGDSFLLSPLFCGSNATGWTRAKHFDGGNMTLASAMAISGAAANPNTGSGGQGLTRSRGVALLMSVMGIGLGQWVAHPQPGYADWWMWKIVKRAAAWLRNECPNRLWPGIPDLLNLVHKDDSYFLQLSDGGHFENLGLYELVRRRVRLIVLCDGAHDPQYEFQDLQIALRRIGEDFGASIHFDADNHLERMMPKRDAGYPPARQVADQGHVVGTITYCDGSKAFLIYLKLTMVPELSLRTKGYQAKHSDFPAQTTANQFFTEDQFEAYRELGYRLGDMMVNNLQFSCGADWIGIPKSRSGKKTKIPPKGFSSDGLASLMNWVVKQTTPKTNVKGGATKPARRTMAVGGGSSSKGRSSSPHSEKK